MHQLERAIDIKLWLKCFSIAERIVCSGKSLNADEAIIHFNTLFEHTEKFFKFTLLEKYTLKECGLDDVIIFPTLSYMERYFAIPPLLNDFNWFPETLNTLLSFFTNHKIKSGDREADEFIRLLALKLKERIDEEN